MTDYQKLIIADGPQIYLPLSDRGDPRFIESFGVESNVYTPASGLVRDIPCPVEGRGRTATDFNNSNANVVSWVRNYNAEVITGFTFEFWGRPNVIPVGVFGVNFAVAIGFAATETNISITETRIRPSYNGVFTQAIILPFVSGQWFHIVANWNSSDNLARVFYNGKIVASNAIALGVIALGNGTHYIGRWAGAAPPFPWNGGLSNVAIYWYALTDTQVKSHYLLGSQEKSIKSLFSRGKKVA